MKALILIAIGAACFCLRWLMFLAGMNRVRFQPLDPMFQFFQLGPAYLTDLPFVVGWLLIMAAILGWFLSSKK